MTSSDYSKIYSRKNSLRSDNLWARKDSDVSIRPIDVTEYYEEHQGNGVICFTPSEGATIGEAFAVREIAAQESRDTVTVVMSRWHAFRAHYIFEQCVGDDIDVSLVHADADENEVLQI